MNSFRAKGSKPSAGIRASGASPGARPRRGFVQDKALEEQLAIEQSERRGLKLNWAEAGLGDKNAAD